ncbi:ZSCAN29 [Branchiostoma lanceolatum]|uniref:ZSCAN29 protein n=1 Tax=Branchiostoma lanceolatum TaxID=7740 RepID=A0A8J9YSR6_BRALA|nr:ZSCAN29 [Branchiostoma lanceolatum]
MPNRDKIKQKQQNRGKTTCLVGVAGVAKKNAAAAAESASNLTKITFNLQAAGAQSDQLVLQGILALISDQVLEARQYGVSAMSLCDPSPSEEARIMEGKVQLMFTNPETLVLDPKWRDLLMAERFQHNIIGIVVDHVHKTPSCCDCCGQGYREVTYPYCLKDMDFDDYVKKPSSCMDQNTFLLKKDHKYYYQAKFKGSYRNQNVYKEVAAEMAKNGFSKTWKQCRSKVKNLKVKYRKVRDHNENSGAGRVTCPFYDILHALWKDDPSIRPRFTVDSMGGSDADNGEGGAGEGSAFLTLVRSVYLLVGHTDKYIDQFFCRIATELQNRDAITVDELVDVTSDSSQTRVLKEVNAKSDVTAFLEIRSVFVPFVDGMVEQLATRIQQFSAHTCCALLLIPSNLHNLREDHIMQLQQY